MFNEAFGNQGKEQGICNSEHQEAIEALGMEGEEDDLSKDEEEVGQPDDGEDKVVDEFLEGGGVTRVVDLEDGFYEIEDIRKKRTHKGKLQYLVKWRGWPESANTWEPVDNLISCLDIIDAFEERMRSSRSGRKRKRRVGRPHTSITKKKSRLCISIDTPFTAVPIAEIEAHHNLDRACTDGASEENKADIHDEDFEEGKIEKDLNEAEFNNPINHGDQDTSRDDLIRVKDGTETNKPGDQGVFGNISINLPSFQEDNVAIGRFSKNLFTSASEGTMPLSGAKRRKQGPIKRHIQDTGPCSYQVNVKGKDAGSRNGSGSCSKGEKSGNDDVGSTADGAGIKNALDGSTGSATVTKILRVVKFCAHVVENIQDVSVTFEALRSDGQRVFVTDQDLKAENPLLLIGYYEQHLRYSKS